MPSVILRSKCVKVGKNSVATGVSKWKNCSNLFSVNAAKTWYVADAATNTITQANVFRVQTGAKSSKDPLISSKISTIEYVPHVSRQLNVQSGATRWYVSASRCFVILAERNGCRTILSMGSVIEKRRSSLCRRKKNAKKRMKKSISISCKSLKLNYKNTW